MAWTEPITNRTCNRCHHTTEIDDEIHLLFNCDTGRNACNEDDRFWTSADNPRSFPFPLWPTQR
jgi:hypothetical protein